MSDDFIRNAKKKMEDQIPAFDSPGFDKMREQIRKNLAKKESDLFFEIRKQKILLLGDWKSPEDKALFFGLKNHLLENGLFTETVDSYYNLSKPGGLDQLTIFEECCIRHQLIIFMDGTGPGTVTEQSYLRAKYEFHVKTLFFIDSEKFEKIKHDPSSYASDFSTIIVYPKSTVYDIVLAYAKYRVYRLARIIKRQASENRGILRGNYVSWPERLGQSIPFRKKRSG